MNLAAMFHFSSEHDVAITAAYMGPLLAINIFIMIPNWSSWSLPKLGSDEERIRTAGTKISASATTYLLDNEPSDGSSQRIAGGANSEHQPAVHKDSGGSQNIPASSWGKSERMRGLSFKALKDALHLAQGHYTANNPTGHLNFAAEMVIASVNCMAIELLYRGVAITLISDWLCDRFYEAGSEDFLMLPFNEAFVIDTPDLARWSTVFLMVTVSAALVLRKVGYRCFTVTVYHHHILNVPLYTFVPILSLARHLDPRHS